MDETWGKIFEEKKKNYLLLCRDTFSPLSLFVNTYFFLNVSLMHVLLRLLCMNRSSAMQNLTTKCAEAQV